MRSTIRGVVLVSLLAILVLAGCQSSPSVQPKPTDTETSQSVSSASSVAPAGFATWDDVLTQPRGATVNWYLWGGSAAINEFVDTFYGDVLQQEFAITLNRVPVADTRDAVNLVLSETEAGKKQDGSVDLIGINGQNFAPCGRQISSMAPGRRAYPTAPWSTGIIRRWLMISAFRWMAMRAPGRAPNSSSSMTRRVCSQATCRVRTMSSRPGSKHIRAATRTLPLALAPSRGLALSSRCSIRLAGVRSNG
jgi:hypothetical protein